MKKVLYASSLLASLVGCASSPPAPVPAPVVVPTIIQRPIPDYREESAPIKDPVQNRVTGHFAQIPDFEAHAMSRAEVISASDQCMTSNMKPFVEYVTQKTDYGRVLVPINVHCVIKRD